MKPSTTSLMDGLSFRRSRKVSWGIIGRSTPLLDRIVIVSVVTICLVALVGPSLAPDVYASNISQALSPPSGEHWLGTDDQGRDVLWRIVVGSRVSLGVAVTVVAGAGLLGCLVAVLATVGPRWLDEVLMRVTDAVLSFPSILFALAVTAALGVGLSTVLVALIFVEWTMSARLLRGLLREAMQLPYVAGARVLGVSNVRLMIRHVLPNAIPALCVKWAGDIGNTVIVIGGLSFIGAGAQPPSAEWGATLAAAQGYVSTAWWIALFPGLALAITTASFGLLGDVFLLRTDPVLRQSISAVQRKGVAR